MLQDFQKNKNKFLTSCCYDTTVQDHIIGVLVSKDQSITKYSDKYNSSIKHHNLTIRESFNNTLKEIVKVEHGVQDRGKLLDSLSLSHKTIFQEVGKIQDKISAELLTDFKALLDLKQKIILASSNVIQVTVKNQRNFSSFLDFHDLLQEAYIIADESLLLFDLNYAKGTAWENYLGTRIHKILTKLILENQPTLKVSRDKSIRTKVTHLSISDSVLLNQLESYFPKSEQLESIGLLLKQILSEKELEYIKLRFGLDGGQPMKLGTVAKKLGISPRIASLMESEIITRLKENL